MTTALSQFWYFLIPHASAQWIGTYVDTATLNTSWVIGGGTGFARLLLAIVLIFRPYILAAALIAITIVGIRMVIGQEDDSLDKGKTVITACVTGIIVSFLIDPFVAAFVIAQSGGINPGPAGALINTEIAGIIQWSLALAGALALLMIIVTGLKAVGSPTNEEGISNIRKTVFSVIAGIVVLTARGLIGGSITSGRPDGILAVPIALAEAILVFIALLAVAVIVYAGVLMLINFGNEERISQGKSLIWRAVTGLVIILISYTLIHFVIRLVTG